MSQSEVFRPSHGELIARSGLNEGYPAPMDTFRKSSSRPSTQGGYRFGQLSQNSFFTRHNPHPGRVRHIKGLLDVPICAVNDDGYFSSPRYSLQFPPNSFNINKLQRNRIPVNAINVNSQLHPINTVTGLQYFTGLNSYPFREKAIPKVGMVPVTEAWRDELKVLTEQIGLLNQEPKKPELPRDVERPKTQYSETTGRLIPPPSRAMSRQASRQSQRMQNFMHIAEEPDMEAVVMTMLCQILQTEDINAVQAWLVSAGEREKSMVMEMIRAALSSKDDYYQRDYPMEYKDKENTTLPPINDVTKPTREETAKSVDRLLLEDGGGEKMWRQAPSLPSKPMITDDDAANIRPPTTEAFKKPPSRMGRPASQAGRHLTPLKPRSASRMNEQGETTLRYTNSAQGKREPAAPAEAPKTPEQKAECSENTF